MPRLRAAGHATAPTPAAHASPAPSVLSQSEQPPIRLCLGCGLGSQPSWKCLQLADPLHEGAKGIRHLHRHCCMGTAVWARGTTRGHWAECSSRKGCILVGGPHAPCRLHNRSTICTTWLGRRCTSRGATMVLQRATLACSSGVQWVL